MRLIDEIITKIYKQRIIKTVLFVICSIDVFVVIWLFLNIHLLNLDENIFQVVISTLISGFFLYNAMTHANNYFHIKVYGKYSKRNQLDRLKKHMRDNKVKLTPQENLEYQALYFSLFYINSIFFSLIIVLSSYLFIKFSVCMNFVFTSIVSSSALVIYAVNFLI